MTKNTAKLDRETEELHHDRVPLEVGKVIQQGRQERGLTQKDLATVSIKAFHILTCPMYNMEKMGGFFLDAFTLIMYVAVSDVRLRKVMCRGLKA